MTPAVGHSDAAEGAKVVEHRDRKDRTYRYDKPAGRGQGLIGAAGGALTGLLGFGVGVLGVAHLVEMSHSGTTPPWNIVAATAS